VFGIQLLIRYSRATVPAGSVPAVYRINFHKLQNSRQARTGRYNPAAHTRQILDSSSFVSEPTPKRQKPLLSYVREYTVNEQCSVQYTLLLFYLMFVMCYCA
jgi:hypothetical protein